MLAEVPIYRRLPPTAEHTEQFIGTGPYRFADLKLAAKTGERDAGSESIADSPVGTRSTSLGVAMGLIATKAHWSEVAKSPRIDLVTISDTAAALAAVQVGRVDIAEMGAVPRNEISGGDGARSRRSL